MPNQLRSSMTDLIAKVRSLIADPAGASQQFQDLDVQNALDRIRDDVRYEMLLAAPSIVNTVGVTGTPDYVWADYYSQFQYWENDAQLQGPHFENLIPLASDWLVGHWQFELNVFTTGTPPGEYPPVFITGKVYDVYWAAADLLEMWAAVLLSNFDFTSDGQSFRRSQVPQAKFQLASVYRRQAKPKRAVMVRNDIESASYGERVPLLGNNDAFTRE
jgi:hypothetical protein